MGIKLILLRKIKAFLVLVTINCQVYGTDTDFNNLDIQTIYIQRCNNNLLFVIDAFKYTKYSFFL